MSASFPHKSILIDEYLEIFADCNLKVFVDGTLGAGGHAEAILARHPEIELFIGIDQDPLALEIASVRLAAFGSKVQYLQGNFRTMIDLLAPFGISGIDGCILDIGVSSMQLDTAQRGMSFSKNGPLDMRMGPLSTLTAAEIINEWSEEKLGRLFRDYGEEPRWRMAARAIVSARQKMPIQTTQDLAQLLRPLFPYNPRKPINPLTLIFQALRIAVNDELSALEDVLPQLIQLLNPGGRLSVISFHSLEDRIVKNLFRILSGYAGGKKADEIWKEPERALIKILTRKPLIPSEKEQQENPRSRSAKMRVIEKI